MKALVTGATGFIGSHLADLLYAKGYEVSCTVRKTSSLKWLENKPYNLIESSLNDRDSLNKAVKDVDYIFHAAGLTAARNYDEFLKGNRDGTANILEAALNNAPNLKRFLFLSSQTAAGPSKSYDEPVNEFSPCNPLTSYGKSKYAAEQEVQKYRDKMPFTIVRAPAVFGPRDVEIYKIFKTVKMGLGTMVGLNKKYLNLIHSTDLTRGITEAAESDNTIGHTYFVASEDFYNWDQLIDIIKNALGKKFVLKVKIPQFLVLQIAGISGAFGKLSKKPPVFNYEKGIDFIQDYWTCSVEKAKKDFGYRQLISIEDGIESTIRWYFDNKWL